MEYGQFCPIAKATEILGEKWTILIVRELIMGGQALQRAAAGAEPDFPDPVIETPRFTGTTRPGAEEKNPRPEGL